MDIKKRIEDLRKLMIQHKIDYYLVPSSDYHQSEYVGEYFKCREAISGFRGSAGTVIIGLDFAGLWTDGRYFIQAEREIKGNNITLFKMGEPNVPTILEFIKENMKDKTLGFDGKVVGTSFVKSLPSDVKICSEYDLVDKVWHERPKLPMTKAFIHELKYTGEGMESKIGRIQDDLISKNLDMTIITSIDDIAWIFNLRGHDVHNNPVNLAYSIISTDKVILYIFEQKLDEEVEKYLAKNSVEVRDYFEIYDDVRSISNANSVLLDEEKVNYTIYSELKNVPITNAPNISTLMKACKNSVQIENLRNLHIRDGVYVTKFMYWLKNNISKIDITEISASDYIDKLRRSDPKYVELSFDTISAYGANAAMMHYKAHPTTQATVKQGGMLLVDSGGQYYDGTTDITRTFILGEIDDELKKHFTLTLKGMIRLSKAKFLYGISGTNLDALARSPLWELGIDYKCGTGHGVGYFLNVHEGPQNIRMNYNPQKLEIGMVVTDEPGVYIEGSHGIRLENELLVQDFKTTQFGKFLEFETLTFAPLDIDGILPELLDKSEIEFLNNYHKQVYEKLSPYLNNDEQEFLARYTREI